MGTFQLLHELLVFATTRRFVWCIRLSERSQISAAPTMHMSLHELAAITTLPERQVLSFLCGIEYMRALTIILFNSSTHIFDPYLCIISLSFFFFLFMFPFELSHGIVYHVDVNSVTLDRRACRRISDASLWRHELCTLCGRGLSAYMPADD